jgi:hypothetical protein
MSTVSEFAVGETDDSKGEIQGSFAPLRMTT